MSRTTALCWGAGYNYYGELGNGTNGTATSTNAPILIYPNSVESVYANGYDLFFTAIRPAFEIELKTPQLTNGHVQLNFTLTNGIATQFKLLQKAQLGLPWTTNYSATFTTNIAGVSYRFSMTNAGTSEFYKIQTP